MSTTTMKREVLNWGSVTKKTWFLVMAVTDVTTGFGPTKILTLKDRSENTFKVWGSKALNGAIGDKWVEKGDGLLFVKCLGKNEKKGAISLMYLNIRIYCNLYLLPVIHL